MVTAVTQGVSEGVGGCNVTFWVVLVISAPIWPASTSDLDPGCQNLPLGRLKTQFRPNFTYFASMSRTIHVLKNQLRYTGGAGGGPRGVTPATENQ